jgi:hypothetical protein
MTSINVNMNEMKMKGEFISSIFKYKINENEVVCVTWDVGHRPLNITWHLIQFQL